MIEEAKDEDTIVVGDYIFYDKEQVLRTEVYYVTKQSQIKGMIYLQQKFMVFEPANCPENHMVR